MHTVLVLHSSSTKLGVQVAALLNSKDQGMETAGTGGLVVEEILNQLKRIKIQI